MIVVYHRDADGLVAALQAPEDSTFIDAQYGEEESVIEAILESSERQVFVLDFFLPPITGKKVTVLDHHKTAYNKVVAMGGLGIGDYVYYETEEYKAFIDLRYAGCEMARWYFEKPSTWLVQYVQDHDLWRFKLPYSKEIRYGLPQNLDMAVWRELDMEETKARGLHIYEYIKTRVANLVMRANDGVIIGCPCKVLNHATWISEVGDAYDGLMVCWFWVSGGDIVFSLRGPGARHVAEAFGGGGHDEAAGFKGDWNAARILTAGEDLRP